MKGKIIVPLLLASVTTGVVATTRQNVTVSADTVAVSQVVGDLLEITNFSNKGELGQPYYLPNVTVQPSGAELDIIVTDPAGRTVTVLSNNGDKYFVPAVKGYYSVTFATKDGTKVQTSTHDLKIFVEGASYSVVPAYNSKYVVPSVIPTSSTRALKIPAPKVFMGENELTGEDLIKQNGGLQVFVVNKDGSGNDEPLTTGAYDENNEYYYTWMPSTAGVYEIVYKFVEGGVVQDYKTQRFVVKDNYDISKFALNFNYAGSRPTSAVLGQETKLPKINVIEKTTNKSIESYTSIKVVHIDSGEEMPVTLDKDNNFVFTPTKKGSYRVTYRAELGYFNNLKSNEHSFIIDDVKDTVAPKVRPVRNYKVENGIITEIEGTDYAHNPNLTKKERDEIINKLLTDVSYDIPSVVAFVNGKAEVNLPAMYATDNFSDLSNLKFRITLRSAGGSLRDVTPENFNQSSKIEIDSTGKYTIRYIVTDEAGNENISSYDIEVVPSVDALKEDGQFVKPTINFQALTASVKADGTLTFNAPTATDKFDTRVKVKTYYYFDNDATKHEITEKNEAGQLVLSLKGKVPANAKELYVVAEATNDYNSTPSTITRTVKLINTNDNDIPVFVNEDINNFLTNLATVNNLKENKIIGENGYIDNDGYVKEDGQNKGAPFNQQDTIILPTIRITDATDHNLEVSVKVFDQNGKSVNLQNAKYSKTKTDDGYIYTISEGSFTANISGLYTVTYTAKDAGGNMVFKSFAIRVRSTEKPTIMLSSFDPFVNEVEVGKFVEIPSASLKHEGKILEDVTFGEKVDGVAGITWKLQNSSNVTLNPEGQGFTPLVPGQFVVIYEAWSAEGNKVESRAYTVVAKDTIKPTIKLESDLILPESVPFNSQGENVITLPGYIEIYDGFRDETNFDNNFDQTDVKEISFSVKVKDSNGNSINVSEVSATTKGGYPITRYEFRPTKNGVYTITYTAVDKVGNTTEIIKTLEVGDVKAPEIKWAEDYEVISNANIGDSFELNLNKAIITDDEDEREDIDVKVYMYDANEKLVESKVTNGYKWTFDQVGDYQLKIILTDKANNKETYTYRISVTEKEEESQVIAPWVGTTLIVVTVVILAGVVTYFVVTSRGGKTTTTTRRRTTTK